MRTGDILGHEFMGEVVETGPESTLHKGQRVVVPFTIACGQCFFCKKQQFSAATTPTRAETSDTTETHVRLSDGRRVRLFAPDRRLCRRPGRICPRAILRRRADRRSRRPRGRQGPVPLRHPPDRLDGGGELRDRAGRYGRGLGLRPGRPVRDPVGADHGRAPGDRDRSLSDAAGAGEAARRGDPRLSARSTSARRWPR